MLEDVIILMLSSTSTLSKKFKSRSSLFHIPKSNLEMTLNIILRWGVMVQGEMDPLVIGVMPMRNAADLISLRITFGLNLDVVVVEVLFMTVGVMYAGDLILLRIILGLDVDVVVVVTLFMMVGAIYVRDLIPLRIMLGLDVDVMVVESAA